MKHTKLVTSLMLSATLLGIATTRIANQDNAGSEATKAAQTGMTVLTGMSTAAYLLRRRQKKLLHLEDNNLDNRVEKLNTTEIQNQPKVEGEPLVATKQVLKTGLEREETK